MVFNNLCKISLVLFILRMCFVDGIFVYVVIFMYGDGLFEVNSLWVYV